MLRAFHWAWKLVIYEFPRPLKSEMSYFQVGNSEFCEYPDFRLGNTSWEIRVSAPN